MEHHYQKLFYTIDRVLRVDWAGMAQNEAAFDPRYYTQAIGQAWNDGVLDELLFLRYVNQMLACTGDRHLTLSLLEGEGYEPYSVGFYTRRCGDALIVTDVGADARFQIGDRITAINGGTPAYHRRAIQKNFFYADTPEREDWNGLLKMAQNVTVERLGEIELQRWPREDTPREASVYFMDDVAVIDPGTLDGRGCAAALIAQYETELSRAEHIVWDLRCCDGTAESDILPLLGWLCTEDTTEGALMGDTELYVNYTERNCALRIAALRSIPGAQDYIRELEEKSGRGLVLETEKGSARPVRARARRVTAVIDTWCRDGGETLALAARRGGARLVGRATLGTLDMTGDVAAVLDGRFVLRWPTAITKAACDGRGMQGRGIEPDVYIPFTPEETRQELVLRAAQND